MGICIKLDLYKILAVESICDEPICHATVLIRFVFNNDRKSKFLFRRIKVNQRFRTFAKGRRIIGKIDRVHQAASGTNRLSLYIDNFTVDANSVDRLAMQSALSDKGGNCEIDRAILRIYLKDLTAIASAAAFFIAGFHPGVNVSAFSLKLINIFNVMHCAAGAQVPRINAKFGVRRCRDIHLVF